MRHTPPPPLSLFVKNSNIVSDSNEIGNLRQTRQAVYETFTYDIKIEAKVTDLTVRNLKTMHKKDVLGHFGTSKTTPFSSWDS